MTRNSRAGFIGAGKMGAGLASCLDTRGYSVAAVSSKSHNSAIVLADSIDGCKAFPDNQQVADSSDVVFIATPDDVIKQVASEIRWRSNQYVVHCSGAYGREVLKTAEDIGAQTASFHPLQSVTGKSRAEKVLPGSAFAIEAEGELRDFLQGIVESFEGIPLFIDENKKALYHLAAVFASNYQLTVKSIAVRLMQKAGFSEEVAIKALLPLLRGTLSNIEENGFSESLTGPIPRGDSGTVENHLRILEQDAPELRALYRHLGIQLISLSQSKGELDEKDARTLRNILDGE